MIEESGEQIKAHLVWIWGEEEGFMKRGKEGMLVITNKRIVFITKTDMTYRTHDVYSIRQLKHVSDGENIFRPLVGYRINDLENDLNKSNENLNMPFNNIEHIFSEEKRWGTILKIKVNLTGKLKSFKFSIVKGWVKYPIKDPLEFQHIDWTPIIDFFNNSI